MTDADKIINP